jgi:uncharacterized protein
MDDAAETFPDEEGLAPVRELTPRQRRVLGVLVEKGYTTPEYYPLTLKAVTTGCNQKSNRHPVLNYSEEEVEEALDQLRGLGLVAVIHTESGRTERFRHYMRKRYPFSEPQLAIMTELMLRGRQQLGELRARASRMHPIETLDELRENLRKLADGNWILSSGPLDRRGIEVDHALYPKSEAPSMGEGSSPATFSSAEMSGETDSDMPAIPAARKTSNSLDELREEVADLKARLNVLADEVAQLKRGLGV